MASLMKCLTTTSFPKGTFHAAASWTTTKSSPALGIPPGEALPGRVPLPSGDPGPSRWHISEHLASSPGWGPSDSCTT